VGEVMYHGMIVWRDAMVVSCFLCVVCCCVSGEHEVVGEKGAWLCVKQNLNTRTYN
jgi:hypothetical protein